MGVARTGGTNTIADEEYHRGLRLRRLYVDQLNFMPSKIEDTKSMYLRASPIPRALESLQQTLTGMFPEVTAPGFPPVDILTRGEEDEVSALPILLQDQRRPKPKDPF